MLSRFLSSFLLCVLWCSLSFAQQAEIDKMIAYANSIRGTNPDSSIIILTEAEKLAADAGYFEAEMLAAYRSIRQNMAMADYTSLEPRIKNLQRRVQGTEFEKYAAEYDFLRGTMLMRDEKVDSAVHCFKKSIEWYLENDMKGKTAQSYVNLSKIYLQQHNTALVKECLDKAYEAMQYDDKNVMKFITLISLTRNSFVIGDYENYSKYLIEGQELSKSFGNSKRDNVSEHALARQVFNIGDDSLVYRMEQSIAILKQQVNTYPLTVTYTALGIAYQEKQDFAKAQEFFKHRLDLEKKAEGRSIALSHLYNNSKQLGNETAALEYLESYHALRDSIFQEDANQKIAELQVEIQDVEKDYKIRAQQKQRNILISSILLLGAFGSYIVYSLMKRNRLNKRIYEQKTEIDSRKIEQLEKENQLTRAQALLEGQEVERTRIANDLHDGLGGLLSTVKAHYSNIKREVVALREMQSSGRVEHMIDEACVEVRRISHDLMPNVLRLDGLKSAIEEVALNLKSAHDIEVDLELMNLEGTLAEKKETFIFRIVQELANNIVKYANAKNVVMQLSRFDKEIVILIEDDGIGFDLDAALKKKGLGLNSTISRVDYLGGEIDINTAIGKGTSVTINIPLEESTGK